MFDRIERARLEDIHFRHDPASGLKAIIAIHNTRLGPALGGKAVIMLPAGPVDRTALYTAFADFIHSLGGRYITAADSGTQLSDLDVVAARTPYVSGTSSDGFNPSPMTALGVFAGIRAAVRHQLQRESLEGLHVAIQGIGNVGFALAQRLSEAGVHLTVSCFTSAHSIWKIP